MSIIKMKPEELRDSLCESLKKVERGELNPEKSKAIIGIANQINLSYGAEVKAIALRLRMGHTLESEGMRVV
jgi:hypothetical protein